MNEEKELLLALLGLSEEEFQLLFGIWKREQRVSQSLKIWLYVLPLEVELKELEQMINRAD